MARRHQRNHRRYIVRRAGALTPQPDLCGLGRRLNTRIVAKPTKFSSKQLGSRESYSLEGIEGVHFLVSGSCEAAVPPANSAPTAQDMCIEVMRSRKERSYKLDYISRVVLAHKNIYELSLVESLWLKEVRSVQILGLGSKKCDWLESPLLFASGRLVDVVDRSTHATLPLVAGDYRLVLSRPQKEQRLFMRFFNEAGRCIGFATCPRASDMHKEDIHYTRITELWNGSDDDRRMLAVYNLVDAMLPWQNMCELRTLGTLIEMARVSKTDITQQMQKGQNVKSTMLLQVSHVSFGEHRTNQGTAVGGQGGRFHRALSAAAHQGEDGQLRAGARLALVPPRSRRCCACGHYCC